MQQNLAVPGTLVLDAAAACGDVSRSPFGEECHLRVRGTDGAYSIVDYRAPAGFGPARHTHRRVDEIIQLLIRLGLLGLLLVWALLLVRPFVPILAWSVVLAVALNPVFRRLSDILGGRPKLAATILTLVNLAVATMIPMSEWRREIENDPRVLATAVAILRDQERRAEGNTPEPGGSNDGVIYSG